VVASRQNRACDDRSENITRTSPSELASRASAIGLRDGSRARYAKHHGEHAGQNYILASRPVPREVRGRTRTLCDACFPEPSDRRQAGRSWTCRCIRKIVRNEAGSCRFAAGAREMTAGCGRRSQSDNARHDATVLDLVLYRVAVGRVAMNARILLGRPHLSRESRCGAQFASHSGLQCVGTDGPFFRTRVVGRSSAGTSTMFTDSSAPG